MEENIGDGIDELIDNELVMEEDEDDENDGLVVDIMGNEEDKAVDLSDEDSYDDDIDSTLVPSFRILPYLALNEEPQTITRELTKM